MFKTLAEYNTAKNFIDKNMEFYDYTLSERMNSNQYNLYLQDTEYYFDMLYEKLRTIEDLIEYLDTYSSEKISKLTSYINQQSKILEDVVDKYTDTDYISSKVTIETNPYTIKDRDSSVIATADIDNEFNISAGNIKSGYKDISSISMESELKPYSNNISTCEDDGIYMSYYNLDNCQEIAEKITITVNGQSDINYTTCEPINSTIKIVKNDVDNNIILYLSSKSYFKSVDFINKINYSGSNRNNLTENSYDVPVDMTIGAIENNIKDGSQMAQNNKYIYDVIGSQDINQDNTEKSEKITDVNTN